MPTYVRLHKEPPKGARNIKREGATIWKVGHIGKVVRAYDSYIGDGDSAYLATVFEGGTFKNINVGSTYDYPAGHGVVDAPPALMERWRKYEAARKEKIRKEQAAYDAAREKERVAYVLTQPHRGGMVQVIKGRKVPIGFVGRVVWAGDSAFGPRLRIQNETGEAYFIAAGNVKVISQPPGFKP
jgi:hypothetical protein